MSWVFEEGRLGWGVHGGEPGLNTFRIFNPRIGTVPVDVLVSNGTITISGTAKDQLLFFGERAVFNSEVLPYRTPPTLKISLPYLFPTSELRLHPSLGGMSEFSKGVPVGVFRLSARPLCRIMLGTTGPGRRLSSPVSLLSPFGLGARFQPRSNPRVHTITHYRRRPQCFLVSESSSL